MTPEEVLALLALLAEQRLEIQRLRAALAQAQQPATDES